MHTLRLLGGIGLLDSDGREVDALLRQPKRIALLAYLALPRPGTWHRRDSVLGTFWSEHDQGHARSALRSALHILRRHLPDGAVRSRGDDELSLAPEIIVTDLAAMSDDLAAGRFAQGLARYTGELLPGIYVAEAEAFEKWLEQERRRVRRTACKAATQLSDLLEKQGDLSGAIDAARRGAELDPDDEAAARRWIALLDRAGDRLQAFVVYERFRNHMADAFGVRPSAETVALLDAVRTRREPAIPVVAQAPAIVSDSLRHQLSGDAPTPAPGTATSPTTRVASRNAHGRWWWLAAPIAIAGVVWFAFRPHQEAAATSAARSLVVLPMSNETGDPKLAYLASGIAEGVARRLEGIGGIRIRSGARSDWSTVTSHDMQTIDREFGTTILLKSSIQRAGDSLEVHASVVDAATSEERTVATHRFSTTGIRDVESRLAADIAGAVFRAPVPALPRNLDRPVNPESYRLMLEGWHQLLSTNAPRDKTRQPNTARDLFLRAVNLDPLNARAWSGLSSTWATQAVSGAIPFDEGYERASAAANRALALDSLQGSAWANLAGVRAHKYGELAVGLELLRKAEAAEPSNPEVFVIKSTLFRSAHLYDQATDAMRVARQLDPLNSWYLDREAGVEICADRPEAALRLYQSELVMNPSDRLAQAGLTRSLALLGRYDDAIASWRRESLTAGDTALAKALADAKGKEGYWKSQHAEGRKRLASLERQGGRIPPFRLMEERFASGDVDGAFSALDKAEDAGTPALYRLSCFPYIDEIRHTPRFAAAVARIGTIRVR